MKFFNKTVQNILVLIVFLALAIAVFWLVQGQLSTPQTFQEAPTAVITETVHQVTDASEPLPTATMWSTSDAVPVTTEPYPIFQVTPIPGPTYTPILEKVESAEAGLSAENSVDGYIFGKTRLIPNTRPYGIQIYGWISDTPPKLLVVRDGVSLETIDINTGKTQVYYKGNTQIRDAIWLPSRQAIAFLVVDERDATKQQLLISNYDQTQNTSSLSSPILTTSILFPANVTRDGDGVVLFDKNWQLVEVERADNTFRIANSRINVQNHIPTGYDYREIYQTAQTKDLSKAIYYNKDWLLLADFTTDKIVPLNLNELRTEDMPPISYVQTASWSPDGSKIALISVETSGESYVRNNLFIFDLQSNSLTLIENDFNFISDLAWSPDNVHLLILPQTELTAEGYASGGLFLVNVSSKKIQMIPVLPANAIIGSSRSLVWSPDGQSIAVVFGNEPRKPGTHIIEVTN